MESARAATGSARSWTGLAAQQPVRCQGILELRRGMSGPSGAYAWRARPRERTCTDLLLDIGLTKGVTGPTDLANAPDHLDKEGLIDAREPPTPVVGIDIVGKGATVSVGTRDAAHVGAVRTRTSGPTGPMDLLALVLPTCLIVFLVARAVKSSCLAIWGPVERMGSHPTPRHRRRDPVPLVDCRGVETGLGRLDAVRRANSASLLQHAAMLRRLHTGAMDNSVRTLDARGRKEVG